MQERLNENSGTAVQAPSLVGLLEDDLHERMLLKRWLTQAGYHVVCFERAEGLIAWLKVNEPHLLCVDLHLPGLNGIEALRHIRKVTKVIPAIVVTSNKEIPNVVEAMRLGAFNYVVKPVAKEHFLSQANAAVKLGHLGQNLPRLFSDSSESDGNLVAVPRSWPPTTAGFAAAAQGQGPVLICGESKLKKQALAQSVHYASSMRAGPFVEIDSEARLNAIIEGEAGSFSKKDMGLPAAGNEAGPGTVFVDNVDRLSYTQQGFLLNTSRENGVIPGGYCDSPISGYRLLVGSSMEFRDVLAGGEIREDLAFRLGVGYISMSGLEVNPVHLEALVYWYCFSISKKLEVVEPVIPPSSLHLILACDWPPSGDGLLDVLTEAIRIGSLHGDISEEILCPILESHFSNQSLSRDATILAMEVAKGDPVIAATQLGISPAALLSRLKIFGISHLF